MLLACAKIMLDRDGRENADCYIARSGATFPERSGTLCVAEGGADGGGTRFGYEGFESR